MYKLSVIVPVYNSEDTIDACLQSILSSTYTNFELIIIDDSSIDNSLNIINEYKKRYSNIRVISNEVNIGQGASRNKGIDLSKGEYITFVDSDDYINKYMYERLFKALEDNNYPDIINTGMIFVKNEEYLNKDLDFASSNIVSIVSTKESLLNDSPSVCNKLFKRSFINDYRFLESCNYEDVSFTTVLYTKVDYVYEMNNPDYFYRRTSNGVSGINYNYNELVLDIFKVIDEIISNWNNLYNRELLIICFGVVFRRVEEVYNWQVEDSIKKEVVDNIYSLLYKRFGSIEDNIKFDLLTRINPYIIDEYELYIKNNSKEMTF